MCISHALQDLAPKLAPAVDHATIMLEEKGSLLRSITSLQQPTALQIAPAKKAGVKALVAAQQARAAAEDEAVGVKRSSFTIKGRPPPRQI